MAQIIPYTRGVWTLIDSAGPIPQPIVDNRAIVGICLKIDWSDVEQTPGVYTWDTMDTAIASAQASGFDKIALGISNSSAHTPTWLTDGGANSLPPDQIVQLLDPAQVHTTFCQYIASPLFWNAIYHQKRLDLITAAGTQYSNNQLIVAAYASFCDHNSLDWNILDTQALISCGTRGIGGDHTVDQVKQWLDAGWTRAKMLQVGKDICDAVALNFQHQNIKLPIGGLHNSLADAPAYQGSVILVSGNLAIQAPAYTESISTYTPWVRFTAADVGQPITSASIPAGATIASVTDTTHATLSAGHAPTASITELATFPNRNPDNTVPPAARGNYGTLAREIMAYVVTRPYANRFFIQRNTVDANWGTPQNLIDNPPQPGSERWIKKMIADAAPISGLQTVSAASFCTCNGVAQCRQNGNRTCTANLQVMQDTLDTMVAYNNVTGNEITFAEIFTADASITDPAWVDAIRGATIAMGGALRGGGPPAPPPPPPPPGIIVPVPTANFRDDVLWALANKMGLDPRTDLMVLEADGPYTVFINSWVRKTWDYIDWPELTLIEERAPDTAHYVSLDQTLQTPIGKVLKVYLLDPSQTFMPCDTQYRLNVFGIHVGFDHGATVFIKFMKRAPKYTANLHDSLATYKIGDLTYDDVTGNVYVSLINLNTNPLTDTTSWALVPFPVTLADIVVQGAYSDALREEGQFAEAATEEQKAWDLLEKRARAALGLPYDVLTDQQRPGPRYRAMNEPVAT